MKRINFFFLALSFLSFRCNITNTQDLLDASFISVTKIDLFAPVDGAVAVPGAVFSFSARKGIANYRFELSTNREFTKTVFEKYSKMTEIAVSASEFSFEPIEYFWRVSDAKFNYTSETRSLQVISANIVYVNPAYSGTVQAGNKSAPYRSIQTGINEAALRRTSPNQAMEVLVSRDGPENGTTADIQMVPAVALRGGYDASNNWARNIALNRTTIQAAFRRTVTFESDVTPSLTDTSILEGFDIVTRIAGQSTSAIYINGGSPTVSTCNIRAQGTGFNNGVAITILGGNPRITGNSIEARDGSYGYGIQISGSSDALIANNSIFAISSSNLIFGIELGNNAAAKITNNTILCANLANGAAFTCFTIYSRSSSAYKPLITNNLLIPLVAFTTSTRAAIYEDFNATAVPGAIENNLIANTVSSGTFLIYRRFSPATPYSDLTFEAISGWTSGSDKARGNATVTWPVAAGLVDLPFQQGISHLPFRTTGSTGNNSTITISAGDAAVLANTDLIDINGDNIPRRITCAGACPTTITFSPAVAGATSIFSGSMIRVFRNNSLASACFNDTLTIGKYCSMFDFRLKRPTAATNAEWDTLRYGGKNTALDVCGEPAGGPGVGAGAQDCGRLTTDASGQTRIATVPGGATPSNAGAAGFSIGAYESD